MVFHSSSNDHERALLERGTEHWTLTQALWNIVFAFQDTQICGQHQVAPSKATRSGKFLEKETSETKTDAEGNFGPQLFPDAKGPLRLGPSPKSSAGVAEQ